MNPPSAQPAFLPPSGLIVHPALGPVRYSIREVSDVPDRQVAQTISMMSAYARADSTDPAVRADAARARATGDPIADTWTHLRRGGLRGMRFVRDEVTAAPFSEYEYASPGRWNPLVESFARPELLARSEDPHGDCDCFCMYGAAHLIILGIPVAFCTVAADASDPQTFTHVYLVAYPGGERVPLDLSHGPYPGWETGKVYRKQEWSIGNGNLFLAFGAAALLGGAMIAYCAMRQPS